MVVVDADHTELGMDEAGEQPTYTEESVVQK